MTRPHQPGRRFSDRSCLKTSTGNPFRPLPAVRLAVVVVGASSHAFAIIPSPGSIACKEEEARHANDSFGTGACAES